MKRTNIIVKGFYWSGSSAFYDLLREYDNVKHIPGEFDLYRRPHLIGDYLEGLTNDKYPFKLSEKIDLLEKNNSRLIKIIKKTIRSSFSLFMHDSFIKRLGIISNKEFRRRDKGRSSLIIESNKLLQILEGNFSLDEKISAANNWIKNIGDHYAPQSEYLLFDHAIWEGHDVNIWSKVFHPFKLIFVYRDPRDQMAQIVKENHLLHTWTPKITNIYGRGSDSAIKFNVDSIFNVIKSAENTCQTLGKDNAIMINFESLILNYEETKTKIENFLGINSSKHAKQYKYLKPERSEKNINIYKDYLTENDLLHLDKLIKWYENYNNKQS